MAAILKIKDANGVWHEIPAIVGPQGKQGVSGVHIGQDAPPDGVNVWLYPDGDVSAVEEWEFDLEDGTTEERTMVLHGSSILRLRQEDGAWAEVPALKGSPGHTPQKGVDYWTTAEQKEISDAVNAANIGAGNASAATSNANAAANAANSAATSATNAANNANSAAGRVETAVQNANTATGLANTAAGDANSAANTANTAAGNANNAANAANTAAGAAETAAGNANEAAGNANAAAEEIRQAKANGEFDGEDGKDGTSVTVSSVTESTVDGGTNIVNFSDGNKVNIKNGSKGSKGDKGEPYTLTDTDKNTIAAAVKASLTKETWTFTLEDGSIVTKAVYVG